MASCDVFMKIGTIEGESSDSKHKNWIEITSFNFGVTQKSLGTRSIGSAAAGGRAEISDFTVTKRIDKATPKLMLACFKGDHVNFVNLELCRATGEKTKFLEYKMHDCLITKCEMMNDASSDLPSERVSFNFSKLEVTYTATDPKTGKAGGQVASNVDLTENKGA